MMAKSPIPNSDNADAVRTMGLCKSYGKPPSQVHALREVTMKVSHGERIGLLGKSGSGKSTLLNLLGGLDQPSGGSISVLGQDLSRLSSSALANYRLETVGMIFQSFNLIPSRSALQNVSLPLIFSGMPGRQRKQKALAILDRVGLSRRAHHLPIELSGGEQQRVAIARALVNNPAILLADEPTGNLDSITAAEIIDLLMEHVHTMNMTLLLVTHDEELAGRCTDRILHLQDGALVN